MSEVTAVVRCGHGWRGAPAERIETPCPSCGARSLFIGGGGHLTCSVLRCSNPSPERVITDLKAEVARLAAEVARRDRMLETWRFAYPEGPSGRLMARGAECSAPEAVVP